MVKIRLRIGTKITTSNNMAKDFEKWYNSYVSGKPICMERKRLARDAFDAGSKHKTDVNMEHLKNYMRNKP